MDFGLEKFDYIDNYLFFFYEIIKKLFRVLLILKILYCYMLRKDKFLYFQFLILRIFVCLIYDLFFMTKIFKLENYMKENVFVNLFQKITRGYLIKFVFFESVDLEF